MLRTILVLLVFVFCQCAELPALGVCYYPEQWSHTMWDSDVQQMKNLGLRYVRVGEFMWHNLEPQDGKYNWTILDVMMNKFDQAGLKVILGTPTATPPKWLIDKYGGDGDQSMILPFDQRTRARKFGSRRHYRFSSEVYRRESTRIVTEMLKRYGNHNAVSGIQLDNEYGCHDTVRSYDSFDSLPRFRKWLSQKYASVSALNTCWGNTFWSMSYNNYSEIDLPNQAVTESNPPHWLDFFKYSSDEVCSYNKMQFDIARQYSPGRFITTNFMGFFNDFDHFDVAQNLDIASHDSYPLGFTDMSPFFTDQEKILYARTAHPDVPAFHHDLYSGVSGRGLKRSPFIVMEQQPGQVNWAAHNPSPAAGMIRLWTWEAIAHDASLVSYFRWRQVPYAQEQMHAGLNRPDNVPDVAFYEALQTRKEIESLSQYLLQQSPAKSTIAMIYDYTTLWVFQIQPQGMECDYLKLFFTFYSEVRKFGYNIDILKPGASLLGYDFVIVPSLAIVSDVAKRSFDEYIRQGTGKLIFGPRTGSKTECLFQIPTSLPPASAAMQRDVLPLKVVRVETFRPGSPFDEKVKPGSDEYNFSVWKEWLELSSDVPSTVLAAFTDDKQRPAIVEFPSLRTHYLAVYPTREILSSYLKQHLFKKQQIAHPNLRIRKARQNLTFAFNYDNQPITLDENIIPSGSTIVLGDRTISGHGVTAWVQQSERQGISATHFHRDEF